MRRAVKKISKGNIEVKRITVVESEPRPTTLLQDSSTFVQDMDLDHSRRLHKKLSLRYCPMLFHFETLDHQLDSIGVVSLCSNFV